jgi:hypothetical protein
LGGEFQQQSRSGHRSFQYIRDFILFNIRSIRFFFRIISLKTAARTIFPCREGFWGSGDCVQVNLSLASVAILVDAAMVS